MKNEIVVFATLHELTLAGRLPCRTQTIRLGCLVTGIASVCSGISDFVHVKSISLNVYRIKRQDGDSNRIERIESCIYKHAAFFGVTR
jgi:hypothetical protein